MLLLVLLAAVVFVPLVIASLLLGVLFVGYAQSIPSSALIFLGIVVLFFAGAFLLSTGYIHTLFLSAGKMLSKKNTSFIDYFFEARKRYWVRTIYGFTTTGIICVLLIQFLFQNTISLILAALGAFGLLLTGVVLWRVPQLLGARSVRTAVRISLQTWYKKENIVRIGMHALFALIITVIFYFTHQSAFSEATLLVTLFAYAVYFLFVLNIPQNPIWAFITLVTFGASGFFHALILLIMYLVFGLFSQYQSHR